MPPLDRDDDVMSVEASYRLKNKLDMAEEERKELKEKTFHNRRKLLANAKAPLQEIKDRLPWLFSEDEVSTLPQEAIGEGDNSVGRTVVLAVSRLERFELEILACCRVTCCGLARVLFHWFMGSIHNTSKTPCVARNEQARMH